MGGIEGTDAHRTRMLWAAAAGVAVLVIAVVAAVLGRGTEGAAAADAPAGPSASAPAPTSPSASEAAAAPAPEASASTAALPPSEATLVLGDSLGLVVYPWLADALPDREVSYEAVVGRTTARTADRLTELDPDGIPRVVIVSSGTNDPLVADFEESAARVLDLLGPDRCIAWFDVVRPDEFGDPGSAIGEALTSLAAEHPNLRIVRWSATIEADPDLLSGDGIHPTQDGAKARSDLFAAASTACSPLDPSAPRAPKQVLPDSAFWAPSGSS